MHRRMGPQPSRPERRSSEESSSASSDISHPRQHARPPIRHRRTSSDSSEEEDQKTVTDEKMETFIRVHHSTREIILAMLLRHHKRILKYLDHHGIPRPDAKNPEQTSDLDDIIALAQMYDSIPAFSDVYPDALFQAGVNIRLMYAPSLTFKPGYTLEYVYLVLAYYLPTISRVVERHGHQMRNIVSITGIRDVQRLIDKLQQRGTDMILAMRAAISECAPDLLRSYPPLSRNGFNDRNMLFTGLSGFTSPMDKSSLQEYHYCRFKYVSDVNGHLSFTLDNPPVRPPEPVPLPFIEPKPRVEPGQVPSHIQLVPAKPKRSAFAVYSNGKYGGAAPVPIYAPINTLAAAQPILRIDDMEPPGFVFPMLKSSQLRVEPESKTTQSSLPSQEGDDLLACPICMDARRCQVLGCGHFLCADCSNVKECPFCREPVLQRIKVFWS